MASDEVVVEHEDGRTYTGRRTIERKKNGLFQTIYYAGLMYEDGHAYASTGASMDVEARGRLIQLVNREKAL